MYNFLVLIWSIIERFNGNALVLSADMGLCLKKENLSHGTFFTAVEIFHCYRFFLFFINIWILFMNIWIQVVSASHTGAGLEDGVNWASVSFPTKQLLWQQPAFAEVIGWQHSCDRNTCPKSRVNGKASDTSWFSENYVFSHVGGLSCILTMVLLCLNYLHL